MKVNCILEFLTYLKLVVGDLFLVLYEGDIFHSICKTKLMLLIYIISTIQINQPTETKQKRNTSTSSMVYFSYQTKYDYVFLNIFNYPLFCYHIHSRKITGCDYSSTTDFKDGWFKLPLKWGYGWVITSHRNPNVHSLIQLIYVSNLFALRQNINNLLNNQTDHRCSHYAKVFLLIYHFLISDMSSWKRIFLQAIKPLKIFLKLP